ncbi:hypothetical protein [Streptomonospora litoralis]|uniref:DUF3137 domain-containing protein n=1 Tax=Streptomonospora litoralis TaxID=2498135 RepID=A0A4P6Q0K9_9ACTN|nr:hypothetical protein [Streptomonospora litoralis]QBI52067.1 hypothetical protein EKD16_01250 [Streptomonospora litoralis]
MDYYPHPFVLLAASLLALAATFLAPRIRYRLRGRRFAAWAQRHGWRYTERSSGLLGTLFPALPPGMAEHHRLLHVLTGTHRSRSVVACDHLEPNLMTAPGNTERKHLGRVVAVAIQDSTPLLDIRDRNEPYRSAPPDTVGLDEISTGDRRFDGAFRVSTSDAVFARAVLTPEMTARLLTRSAVRLVPLRFTGDHLMSVQPRRLAPDRVRSIADDLIDILEAVPGSAWEVAPRT